MRVEGGKHLALIHEDACGPREVSPEVALRFRGGLVFKAHRRLYHSTLGLRVIKKKKKHLALIHEDACSPREVSPEVVVVVGAWL